MLLIPVLDISGGAAVHAQGGDRTRYRPVRSALTPDRPGDARALGKAYRALGAESCYVADLDAIEGVPIQSKLLRALATPGTGFGRGLMVDAAIADAERALEVLALGATRIVVGLETLPSLDTLRRLTSAVESSRLVFSVDLREGRPLFRHGGCAGIPSLATPAEVVTLSMTCGVRSVILLDLARVGRSAGTDLGLLAELRRVHPEIEIFAGGGVRGRSDLQRLAEIGCTGALVATALHTGVLGPGDIRTTPFASDTSPPRRTDV
ncbi:MAG: HisA/HisF-related TIM barrel protein [Gemmatimonadota bacterium]